MRSKILSLSKSRFLGLLLVAILIAGAVLIFPVNNVAVPFAGKVITIGYSGSAGATVTLDYTVDGADDHVQIQAALDALPSTGGELVIIPLPATVNGGVYDFGAIVTRAINNVTISGTGNGTSFANNGATAIFSAGAQSGWIFKDFATDAGGVNVATATNTYRFNIWVNGALVNDFVDDSPANGVAAEGISSNWAYDHNAAATGVHGAGGNTILNTGDIDDTPNNGDTSDAISSNWAYDYSHTEPAITVYASNALNKPTGNLTGVYYLCDGTADNVEINAAIDALSAGRTWKERVKLIGIFYLQAPISMPDYTVLDLYDATLMAEEGTNRLAGPFIKNDDWVTLGNAGCEIWGGTLVGDSDQTIGTRGNASWAAGIAWVNPGTPTPLSGASGTYNNYALVIKDTYITNTKADGLYANLSSSGNPGNIAVRNSRFVTQYGSVYGMYLNVVADSWFEGVNANGGNDATGGGLYMSFCTSNVFSGIYFGSGKIGLTILGSRDNHFTDIRFDAIPTHGIDMEPSWTYGNQYNTFQQLHFHDIGQDTTNTYACIYVNGTGSSDWHQAYNLFSDIVYRKETNSAKYIIQEAGTAGNINNNSYFNIQGDAAGTATISSVSTSYEIANHFTGVDDTPVNGEVSAPISSNWAYDYINAENHGNDTIASGATSKIVSHGLSSTPTIINITFTEQGTSDYGRWWISGGNSTAFTLNVSADPGASNLDFWWEARIR